MISIYNLKPAFQQLLRPISNFLAKRGVTANQVTVFAIVLSFLYGIFLISFSELYWPLLCLPLMLLFRMMLNAIDGMLAREHHMQSDLGIFLNELGDVLSDTFIYLPFAFFPLISTPLILAIIITSIISEMVGVIGIQIGTSRRYDGPMGKSDRAFVFGGIGLCLGVGIMNSFWVNVAFSFVFVGLIITIFNRIKNALKETTK